MVFGCRLDDAGWERSELYDPQLKRDDDVLRDGDKRSWMRQFA